MAQTATFPGGSKSRMSRAGANVRLGNATPEDLAVIEDWRAAHRGVLNTSQAIQGGKVLSIHRGRMRVADDGQQLACTDGTRHELLRISHTLLGTLPRQAQSLAE